MQCRVMLAFRSLTIPCAMTRVWSASPLAISFEGAMKTAWGGKADMLVTHLLAKAYHCALATRHATSNTDSAHIP